MCFFLRVGVVMVLVGAAADSISANMCKFEETYPRQYVAYMLQPGDAPPVVDGKLDEPVWADVPWTEDFVDIATNVTPRYRTRAKVRWDSTWL
jgi:hypothetical protein